MDPIKPPTASNGAYNVTWSENGVKKTIRRIPPPRLHTMLPEDVVELTTKRSDDFLKGEDYEIKAINPRHPNTIQIKNSEGQTTFVEYFKLEPEEKRILNADGTVAINTAKINKYLRWP